MHLTQRRIPDAADAALPPPTRLELVAYWTAWIVLALGIGTLLYLAW